MLHDAIKMQNMRSGDHKKEYGTFVYHLDEHTVEEIENVARSVL
jgi:hypothetical protein